MDAAGYSLTANPANRYSIGDHTPGVVKDTDGGRTLYIQAAALRTHKESTCRALPRAPGS
jgi:hypothetical protein